MKKSEKIMLLSNIVLIGFIFAVIYHYLMGFYLNFGYPSNSFLSDPSLAFSDFTKTIKLLSNLNPFENSNFWMNYFPLAYIILFPFTLIKNAIVSYLIFAGGFIISFAILNIKFFKCKSLTNLQNFQNIFILSFLSYPFLYILDRGNFDMLLFILFTSFVFTFKAKRYLLAAVLIAIENACKPFSILFLSLFLFKRKYKEFFISLILSLLLIVVGFLVIKGDLLHNLVIFISNLKITQYIFVFNPNGGMSNCSSLFLALKTLLCLKYNLISTPVLSGICKYISSILTLVILWFSWKEKTFWKQISLLTFAMIIIPYIVFDYKLLFLFIPIWLFVNTKEKTKFDLIYTILFGLLLIPKKNLLFGLFSQIGFSVVINPIIILLFLGIIIFEQFYNKRKEQKIEH